MRVSGVPKRAFRDKLVERCHGCAVQHTGWPCGTCYHGNPTTWRAILAFRGDYEDCREAEGYRMASDIVFDANGNFSHHVFEVLSLGTIRQEIRALWAALNEEITYGHDSVDPGQGPVASD